MEMLDHSLTDDVPSPDECRAVMDRIVSSETFIKSPQLGAFLRFVVEESLRGNSDHIKGYTIGTKVLNRPEKFDPQIDPIVRVEATRLRRAIERYYSGVGASDPILLELPRGTYVPAFRQRDVGLRVVAPKPNAFERCYSFVRRRLLIAAMLLLVVCVAGAFVVEHFAFTSQTGVVGSTATREARNLANGSGLRLSDGMPNLSVRQFQVTGQPLPGSILAKGLFERVQYAFSRFDLINIVTEPMPNNRQLDYNLLGFVEYHPDGTATLHFQLQDVIRGILVWSRSFDHIPLPKDRATVEDNIIASVAPELLGVFGVVHSRDRALQLAINDGDPRYRCSLEAADAIRSFDPSAQDSARACLETLTAMHPDFVVGFSLLAQIFNRQYLFGIGGPSGDRRSLDIALRTARHAIELAPNSALAHLILMQTLYARHDAVAALATGEKAIALNKYDPIAMGALGFNLVLSGNIERGMKLLRAASPDEGVRPAPYHFALFLGSYLTGDMQEAVRQSESLVREHYIFTHLSRALIAQNKGDRAEALTAMDRLAEINPAWRTRPKFELEKFIFDPSIVDRLTRKLAEIRAPAPN